jgi:sugar phosphate isomerase/epimerase
VLAAIERLKGRIGCTHLKDYQITVVDKDGKPEFKPTFAPVGNGLMNFPAIVEKMRESGAEYFFVEQDNAAKLPDTLGEVEQSIRYIQTQL